MIIHQQNLSLFSCWNYRYYKAFLFNPEIVWQLDKHFNRLWGISPAVLINGETMKFYKLTLIAVAASALLGCSQEAKKETDKAPVLDTEAQKQAYGLGASIQYEVIVEADGEKPLATETVVVHYAGTLLNGEEFDSSIKRGQPAVFPLNRVIAGWTEGVQLMSVGAKYKFTIPSDLAYGPNGNPPTIPGNAVLQFEIELLEIKKPELAAEAPKLDVIKD